LLLVIDDLHWADATPRARWSTSSPAGFVASARSSSAGCRPEALHGDDPLALSMTGWVRSDLATKVELTPLGPLERRPDGERDCFGRPVSANLRDLI